MQNSFHQILTALITLSQLVRKKIKITFNTKVTANNFLTYSVIRNIGFTPYIPSTLIYSYGFIRVDTSLIEADFWDGLNNSVRAIAFIRISTKKDNVLSLTRVVEIKFLSKTLYSKFLPTSVLQSRVTIAYASVTRQNFSAIKLNAATVV